LLSKVHKNVFGYTLANGTYGTYIGRKRLWK